jgi:hypothetical protein
VRFSDESSRLEAAEAELADARQEADAQRRRTNSLQRLSKVSLVMI